MTFSPLDDSDSLGVHELKTFLASGRRKQSFTALARSSISKKVFAIFDLAGTP